MTIEAEMMRIYLKSQTAKWTAAKRTAAADTSDYHWSESNNCYVPIFWMHPMWARNALDKYGDDRRPADEIDRIYIKNLMNRATTPANRISEYKPIFVIGDWGRIHEDDV